MSNIQTTNKSNYGKSTEDKLKFLVPSDSDLEDTTTIKIHLSKTGEPGSGYHTRNDPSSPFQRSTVTDRRGIIQVRCESREIVHGSLSPDLKENATLLVYDLQLDAARLSRRILRATLEFEFTSSVPGNPGPEVHDMVPMGRVALCTSSQEESVTRGAAASAVAVQFVEGELKWQKTISRSIADEARVSGTTLHDDYGKAVGAKWVLIENATMRSGVPTFFRCAILLNRKSDNGNFQCRVKIKAEADWKSQIGTLFGSTPADDPVLFDPRMPPTNKLRKEGYDLEKLGGLHLDDFVKIVFQKEFVGDTSYDE